MDAFDADVLVYAATGDRRGEEVRRRLAQAPGQVGVGSVTLVVELLTYSTRHGLREERARLQEILPRLKLVPVDDTVASAAVVLGARYGLRSLDAVHLASAVAAGADQFVTNNRSDLARSVVEIAVTYPKEY